MKSAEVGIFVSAGQKSKKKVASFFFYFITAIFVSAGQ